MDKLQTLTEYAGYESVEQMLEEKGFDSLVPAICMNDGCDYTTEYEPDQDAGWCEMCDTGTCKSALVLLGVI